MGSVAYKLPNKKKLSPRRLSDLALVIIAIVVIISVVGLLSC